MDDRMDPRDDDLLTVGALAERSGLTVRTLHHYDEIGLLVPARRSRAGYRLYGLDEVERLARVQLLKDLGLSLDDIRTLLETSDDASSPDASTSLLDTLALRREALRREVERSTRLLRQLDALSARLAAGGRASIDELLELLETITMVERHFTPEQLDTLKARREALGENAIRRVEAEWPELIAKVRAAMDRGDDPGSDEVQALARRWQELVEQFTGGDPEMAASVREVYRQEPEMRAKTGLDPEIMEYVGRAHAVARGRGGVSTDGASTDGAA